MIWYQSLENGNFYRISRGRVLFRRGSGMWARHESLKPCDLAHFPFIGVNMSHPGGRDNGR